MNRTRLAFLGTPAIACPSLRAAAASHQVELVITQPDRRAGRGRKLVRQPLAALADELGLRVEQPQPIAEALPLLQETAPEVLVVLAYGQLLPPAVLTAAPQGAVNIHFSLLPQLRGAAPINWAIVNGLSQSGVTSMFMDQGLDTGDIIFQKTTPLGGQETAGSLAERLAGMGAQLLLPTLEAIAAGAAPRQPQDHAAATWAPLLSKADGRLDWSLSAVELDRRVRGLDPWPGAHTSQEGAMLKLFAPTAVLPDNQGQAPGIVLAAPPQAEGMLAVACGSGALALGEVQGGGQAAHGRGRVPARGRSSPRRSAGRLMDPRRAAFQVLRDLEEGPAHLETILSRRLASAPARERAFATQLVFSVLRNREYLDHLLAAFTDRPPSKLDRPVLAVLRLGVAEAALMSTPDHAVVDSAVELAKATPARRGRKLVNAVLRQVVSDWRQAPLPPEGKDPAPRLAVEYSHPDWLIRELLAQWPRTEVEAWLKANQEQPPLTLRVNLDKISRAELAKRLEAKAEAVEPHLLVPEALMLIKPQTPAAKLPGFGQGLFTVQDAAAQAMGHLLGVGPGMDVADLCAGAGGKTGHLAALMAGRGRLLAVDPSPGRITALRTNLARLGVKGVEVRQGDARELVGVTGVLDRVLVDAPCTGLGVVGRRPDVRWRRNPSDPERLATLQLELAAKAADLIKPGGALLYCTCTVTRAENQGVVDALLAQRPELRLEWPHGLAAILKTHLGGDGYFRTLPHRDRADAFFAARLVKKN